MAKNKTSFQKGHKGFLKSKLEGRKYEIEKLYNKGFSLRDLSKKYLMTPQGISYFLKKNGIILRPKGTQTVYSKRKISEANKVSQIGKLVSEETRKKISKANKNRKILWANKISKSNKGRIITKGWRDKISKSSIGRKLSEETKNKMKGRIPWNYIDGRSKLLGPARYGDDWEAIRMLVYKRDNFTCQECGITMNETKRAHHIHHIVPFLQSFDNSPNNLITLCPSCHKRIESQIMKELKKGIIQ